MAAGAIYAVLLVALIGRSAAGSGQDAQSVKPAQAARPGALKRLDTYGTRGLVLFNHDNHTTRLNPDPNAPFKLPPSTSRSKAVASCSECHHTVDPVTGAPQLWRCSSCHRTSGDPKNPKGRDGDEQWSETAYHNLCIGCHLASNKGPMKCGDCHQLRYQQSTN